MTRETLTKLSPREPMSPSPPGMILPRTSISESTRHIGLFASREKLPRPPAVVSSAYPLTTKQAISMSSSMRTLTWLPFSGGSFLARTKPVMVGQMGQSFGTVPDISSMPYTTPPLVESLQSPVIFRPRNMTLARSVRMISGALVSWKRR